MLRDKSVWLIGLLKLFSPGHRCVIVILLHGVKHDRFVAVLDHVRGWLSLLFEFLDSHRQVLRATARGACRLQQALLEVRIAVRHLGRGGRDLRRGAEVIHVLVLTHQIIAVQVQVR